MTITRNRAKGKNYLIVIIFLACTLLEYSRYTLKLMYMLQMYIIPCNIITYALLQYNELCYCEPNLHRSMVKI